MTPRRAIRRGSSIPVRALLATALLYAIPATAQEEPATPTIKLGSGRSLDLEGQLQVQVASSSVDSAVSWDAELRRMRLTAVADAGGGFFGTLQTDFGAERARVRDAYVEWRPSAAVALRAGQFKDPFNGIELTSSKRLLVIERGTRIRGLSADHTSTFLEELHFSARNRGFQAAWKPIGDRLTVTGGGWQGAGEQADGNDGKEVAARVEYSVLPLPEKTSRPLLVALAAVTNGYFGPPRDTLRVVEGDSLRIDHPRYATAFEAYAEYGRYLLPGLHVAGNAVVGDNPEELHGENGGPEFRTFLGLQGWGEVLLATEAGVLTGVAPAFRADRFDPDTDARDDANLLLTPGLNLYFGSNVKAQVNLDVNLPEAEELDAVTAFRLQTQLLF